MPQLLEQQGRNECSGSRIRWACSRIRLDERLFGRAHRPL